LFDRGFPHYPNPDELLRFGLDGWGFSHNRGESWVVADLLAGALSFAILSVALPQRKGKAATLRLAG